MSSTSFLQDRLTEKLRQLAIYDAAITSVSAGVESYKLDTGQTEQRVTRSTIGMLQGVIRALETDICLLQNRISGNGGVMYGRPIAR